MLCRNRVEIMNCSASPYVKRPEQGKARDAAFIKDPDGYWIEIVQADLLQNLGC